MGDMVRVLEHKGVEYYLCEKCDMSYLNKDLANKCEAFCEEFKACNIDITKHAVKEEI
jgi:molybdopterin-guanine dinucleotide biosynthesis protein A